MQLILRLHLQAPQQDPEARKTPPLRTATSDRQSRSFTAYPTLHPIQLPKRSDPKHALERTGYGEGSTPNLLVATSGDRVSNARKDQENPALPATALLDAVQKASSPPPSARYLSKGSANHYISLLRLGQESD